MCPRLAMRWEGGPGRIASEFPARHGIGGIGGGCLEVEVGGVLGGIRIIQVRVVDRIALGSTTSSVRSSSPDLARCPDSAPTPSLMADRHVEHDLIPRPVVRPLPGDAHVIEAEHAFGPSIRSQRPENSATSRVFR